MTYYFKHKRSKKCIVVTDINIKEGTVKTLEGEEMRLVDVIDEYTLTYDIW